MWVLSSRLSFSQERKGIVSNQVDLLKVLNSKGRKSLRGYFFALSQTKSAITRQLCKILSSAEIKDETCWSVAFKSKLIVNRQLNLLQTELIAWTHFKTLTYRCQASHKEWKTRQKTELCYNAVQPSSIITMSRIKYSMCANLEISIAARTFLSLKETWMSKAYRMLRYKTSASTFGCSRSRHVSLRTLTRPWHSQASIRRLPHRGHRSLIHLSRSSQWASFEI